MNTALHATRQTLDVGWLLTRAAGRNLVEHWALAIFSVIVATGTWFIIQDVENPRVEGVVPVDGEQEIRVEYVNASPDVTVVDAAFVRVRVESRQDEMDNLLASDFRAVVDLQGFEAGERLQLDVTVTSNDGDVRVLEVIPPSVPVELVPVVEREFEVAVRQTGPLPEGFELAELPAIDPAFVTARGPADLIDNVDRVEVDVNLSGQRADYAVTGDLVARNANGQAQLVALSSRQATVQFSIEQIVQQREFAPRVSLTGVLAPGFRVAAIQLEPRILRVTGADDVLDGITEIVLEPMDVEGAADDVVRTVQVRPIENVTLSPTEVEVTVVVEPIGCDDLVESACAGSFMVVAPQFTNLGAGLVLAPGYFLARLTLVGPPGVMAELDLSDVTATVSLSGLGPGTHNLVPEVTVPPEIQVVETTGVTFTLQATP